MNAFTNTKFELVKIGDVVVKTETRDPKTNESPSFDYVDIGSVCNRTFSIVKPRRIRNEEAPSRARKVIRENDVVFATTRPYLKSIAVVPQSLDNQICSTGFCVLRAGNRVLPEWLFFCAISKELMSQITPLMRGANYPAVTDRDIMGSKIPLPPLEGQRRIIGRIKECLDRVEEIESLRSKTLIETTALFPSLLAEAFDKLSESNRLQVGEVALESRYGTSRKCTTEKIGTPILRIPNVVNGSVNQNELKYCDLEDRELERLRLQDGDLLFVRTNGSRELVGRCAIFRNDERNEDYAFASYLIRVRLNQEVIRPDFLSFFLNSTHGRIELNERRRTSAGQFNINSENLRNIEVPVPSIEVQDQLIDKFSERSAEIEKLVIEQKEAAKEESFLRDYILRKAFAGEL